MRLFCGLVIIHTSSCVIEETRDTAKGRESAYGAGDWFARIVDRVGLDLGAGRTGAGDAVFFLSRGKHVRRHHIL